MGLFSSSKRIYVGTSVSRLVEDNLVPDIKKSSVATAILTNEDIVSSINQAILDSVGIKANQGFNYGKSGYFYGLPNHTFISNNIGEQTVAGILDLQHGTPVTILYHYFDAAHFIHLGFDHLNNSLGYNDSTNEIATLSSQLGHTVYLENIVGVINTATDFTDDNGFTYSPPFNYETAPNARFTPWTNPQANSPNYVYSSTLPSTVIIHYAYNDGSIEVRGTIDIGLTSIELDESYFLTKYSYDSGGNTVIGYFTYLHGSGTYPALDSLTSPSNNDGEFMPFAFFIDNYTDQTQEALKGTPAYVSTKRYLNKLGIDYDEVSEAIHDNPDISQIVQATMLFGIPINSDNAIDKRYLFEFFEWLYTNEGIVSNETDDIVLANTPVERSVKFEDANFYSAYTYGALSSIDVIGSIGEVGTVESTITLTDITYDVIDEDTNQTITTPISVYKFTKQISATEYRDIRVSNLSLIYFIGSKEVYVDLTDNIDSLLIPVNYLIARTKFNIFDRDVLMNRSLHLVFNSRVVKNIPWYATGPFQVFLFLLGAVITVVSLGQAAPGVVAAFSGLAATYGAVIATIILGLKYLAIQALYDFGFKFLADELGAENAFALAMLGLLAGKFGNFQNPQWAENIMALSTNLISAGSNAIGDLTEDIFNQLEAFNDYAEEKLDEIQQLLQELNGDEIIDPLLFLRRVPNTIFGESPENFYNRTVHAGNIGVLSIESIHSYTDTALKLPDFTDSFKELKVNESL